MATYLSGPLEGESFEYQISKMRNEIEALFRELINCLKDRERNLLNELEEILNSYKREINKHNESIKELETGLNLVKETFKSNDLQELQESFVKKITEKKKEFESHSKSRRLILDFDKSVLELAGTLGKLTVTDSPSEVPRLSIVDYKGKVTPINIGARRTKSMLVIGLQNLGNTCNFNSALQNLLYLHPFREQLSRTMTRTEYTLVPKKHQDLPVTTFTCSKKTAEPGKLTKELHNLINETTFESEIVDSRSKKTMKNKSVTPRLVLNEIARKNKKFSDGTQQDCYELLRYLIDTVKDEEIKRLKAAFVDHFDIKDHKSQFKSYSEEKKTLLKKYASEFKDVFVFTGTFIDDTFGGKMLIQVHCLDCGSRFDENEDFLDISLPLPAESQKSHVQIKKLKKQNSEPMDFQSFYRSTKQLKEPEKYFEGSLEHYLLRFFSSELMERDYLCTTCNPELACEQIEASDSNTDSDEDRDEREDSGERIDLDRLHFSDANKQFYIKSLPPVLIIRLKRFSQTGSRFNKVNRHIEFPLVLDMAPFCTANIPVPRDRGDRVLYGLRGTVNHSGSMMGGHYVAYVNIADWDVRPSRPKSPLTPDLHLQEHILPAEEWYYVSDSHFSRSDHDHVFSAQAYILFYERLTLV